MARLNHYIAICLTLAFVLTSGAMAVARGQGGGVGSMVICTGAGAVTVMVDADGQPVDRGHICPDCALNLGVDVAAPGLVIVAALGALVTQASAEPVAAPVLHPDLPQARAPPRV